MISNKPLFRAYLVFFAVLFVWASAYVGIRIVLNDYPPGCFAFCRYMIASLFLGLILFSKKSKEKVAPKHLILFAGLGFMGFTVYNLALNSAEQTASAGLASFISGQTPVIMTIFALLFLNERLTFWGFFGLCMSLLGILIIALGQNISFHFDISLILLLIAAVSSAIYYILQKPLLKYYSSLTLTSYSIFFGTFFLSYYAPSSIHYILHASFVSNLTLFYLGIFPAALGYMGFSYVMNYIPASQAASGLYLLPLLTCLQAFILLHESPSNTMLFGGILSVFGAFIISKNIYTV